MGYVSRVNNLEKQAVSVETASGKVHTYSQLSGTGQYKKCEQYDFKFTLVYSKGVATCRQSTVRELQLADSLQ